MTRSYWKLFVLLLCTGMWITSCGQAEEAEAAIDAKDFFFSLDKFFTAEAVRLAAIDQQLDKTIKINEREEHQQIASVDYKREFSMFRKADINRPAWSDKYRADSTYTGEKLRKIQYTSLDPDLKTQAIEIDLNEAGAVSQIVVLSKTETALAGNQSRMSYRPDRGYQINTTQKNRTAETLKIEILGRFQN